MRNLIKILIVLSVFVVFVYNAIGFDEEVLPIQGDEGTKNPIPKTEIIELAEDEKYLPRPKNGISTLIGKKADQLIKLYGYPTRVEASAYGYDWWIYVTDSVYQMYGIKKNQIKQMYTNSTEIDISPFHITQSLDEIVSQTILETEIIVEKGEDVYIFSMDEKDLKTRIIVPYQNLFAQLYIDQFTNTLEGIRFMDKDILLAHQPYEYQYVGEKLAMPTISSFEQIAVNHSNANQMYELVNEFRLRNNLNKLLKNQDLSTIAMKRTEFAYANQLTNLEESTLPSLSAELKATHISYKRVKENLAFRYLDAIEAYHAWINSEAHREHVLNKNFNSTGIGAYIDSYSQIFIERNLSIKD